MTSHMSPSQHPTISQSERDYIENAIGRHDSNFSPKVRIPLYSFYVITGYAERAKFNYDVTVVRNAMEKLYDIDASMGHYCCQLLSKLDLLSSHHQSTDLFCICTSDRFITGIAND